MSMKEEGANSSDGTAMVQGDRPEAPHMLTVGLLIFLHETQWTGESIGKGDTPGRELLGEPFREKVQDFSTPGEAAAISACLSGRKQLALSFDDIGLDFMTDSLRCQSRRWFIHVGMLKQG